MQNNGGIQYVPQISAAEKQVIYLDFDGEETKYTNRDLDLTLDVKVDESGLSDKRIKEITEQLNRQYADENIEFVTTVPVTGEYSTVYVGNTEAFEPYGEFYGLAEAVDVDNQIKNDNAFVILDQSYSNAEIISVIAHETGHIVSGETHDDTTETLNDYALDKLLQTETATCYVKVQCSGGSSKGTPYVTNDSWFCSLPAGADHAVITITNNGIYSSYHWNSCNTNIYATVNGVQYTVQNEQSIKLEVSASTIISLSRAAVLDPDVASYTNIYSPLKPNIIIGYRYTYYSASVTNDVTITAQYYQNIPIADLKITSASFSKTALDTLRFTPSENFTYSFTVKNIGDLNAGASKAFIYVDGAKYAEVAIAALAAGASKSYSYTFAAGKLKNGKHTIKVVADATGIINEDSESNDSAITDFFIEPAKADLSVTELVIANNDGENIFAEKDIKVTATVQNRSDNKASVQTGASLYVGGTWLKTFTIPILQPGKTFDISYTIPKNTLQSYGYLDFKLVVDPKGWCTEFDESNNSLTEHKTIFNLSKGIITYRSDTPTSFQFTTSGASIKSYYRMNINSGGTAIDTSVNSNGSMFIYSGGTANNTTVNDFSRLYIYGGTANSTTVYRARTYFNGGTADDTTVNSGGSMAISSGTANNTIVKYGGSIYLGEGTANNTTIAGSMDIGGGGKATRTTVNSGGKMGIYGDGTANSTTVNSHGKMEIYGGGTANSTTVNSGGYLCVDDGGKATRTTVNSGGYMCIDCGTANSTTVNSRGSMVISSGTANNTTVNSGGAMYISSGGTANSTTLNSAGYMDISPGGAASNTIVNDRGCMYISGTHHGRLHIGNSATVDADDGATIDFTVADRKSTDGYLINDLDRVFGTPTYTITVSNNQAVGVYKLAQGAADFKGTLTIGNGSSDFGTITVNGAALKYNGITYNLTRRNGNLQLDIFKNPTVFIHSSGHCTFSSIEINDAYIAAGANNSMTISSGGVANNAAISFSGKMMVFNGGTAEKTTISSKGMAFIYAGGKLNNAAIKRDGEAHIYGGGAANKATVSSGGKLFVSAGGKADNTTVDNFGSMYISSGGSANGAIVYYMGQLYIDKGAKLNNGTIRFGKTYISSGGVANNTVVSSGGLVFVSSGGKMETATVSSGGWIHLYYGGFANNATVNGFGRFYVSNAASANNVTVNSNGLGFIYAGGKMNTVTIKQGGAVHVYGGATANSATVHYLGKLYVSQGGIASDTTIKFGKVYLASGAVAKNTTVSSGGLIFVSSGGKMETATVSSGGWIHLYYGGHANNATVNGHGRFYVSNAASANKVTVNSNGLSFIYAGGKMENSTIKTKGSVHIYGGGTANNATITGGTAIAYQNGKLDNTTIQSGKVVLSAGATHKGVLSIWGGASVTANSGSTIDFTISRRKAADTTYFINDLSRINGAPNYTVTVSDNQEAGVYELAQGAASFNKRITVGNGKVNFGTVAVGKTINYGGKSYTLQKNGSDLTMAIAKLPASAALWDAVAEASSEVAMPAGTQECLWESASPAPAAKNALAFPEIASGTEADLSIWQNVEANGCVSTLTENNQPINKFELIA